ncbi:hypothetical protein HZ326_11995 [Fusarium oxysporum f. sp. albedinis]|nr:hypothetical protein HZ326_11995 [Fusarium oxysporum f. sp. albedinis]
MVTSSDWRRDRALVDKGATTQRVKGCLGACLRRNSSPAKFNSLFELGFWYVLLLIRERMRRIVDHPPPNKHEIQDCARHVRMINCAQEYAVLNAQYPMWMRGLMSSNMPILVMSKSREINNQRNPNQQRSGPHPARGLESWVINVLT